MCHFFANISEWSNLAYQTIMGCKFIGRFLPIFSLSRLWLFVLQWVEGTERTKQLRNRVARIFLGSTYQNEKNIPNGRKICHKIYQHFPLYSTPSGNPAQETRTKRSTMKEKELNKCT
jgi:hypothetical protein